MDNNIVISTRIRLARNLKDYPFPCRLSDKGKAEVDEKVSFLWDDGTNDFETLSFMSLEREEGGGMYKKVINMMTKGR